MAGSSSRTPPIDEETPLFHDHDHDNGHGPAGSGPRQDQPLLHAPNEASWTFPRGFFWIQLALMSNVFLQAFDSTITAATYAVISSEFGSANTASWLTTSYLVTSTAVQPLYGRVSDIFGRRLCFFIATVTFGLGCLGCGLARDVVTLNFMRALTGFGGGGLMTMATIVNSDMIPFRRRGMYQAMQNGIWGLGGISGASFGGAIADRIGWRWCFILQVPMSIFALVVGALVVKNQAGNLFEDGFKAVWKRVDFTGALFLVLAISVQLLGLSLGGNELPWTSPWVIGLLAGSVVLFAIFFLIEGRTTAIPIIPLRMLRGRLPVATQIANICAGLCAYGFLFMIPLFFQVILMESATKAGARLAVPSLATPIGSIIAGVVMSRWGKLIPLVRAGASIICLGSALLLTFSFQDASWKYIAFIIPTNLGVGVIYPSILFTTLASFDHADHAVSASTVYLIRSLGAVWGVSITSAIVQTTLSVRLPDALSGISDKWRIIDEIRHSVEALKTLPPDVQLKARLVYFDGIHYAFASVVAAGAIAVIAALVASPKQMRSTH